MSEIYRPGDRVPASGIYKTVHGQQHAAAHYVTALYADKFPTCLECSDSVRFELAAVHVKAHPQFNR